jgi:hypothetical protein
MIYNLIVIKKSLNEKALFTLKRNFTYKKALRKHKTSLEL